MDRSTLEKKSMVDLREIAATMGLKGHQRLRKADLIERIVTEAGGDGGHDAAAGEADEQQGEDGTRRDGRGGRTRAAVDALTSDEDRRTDDRDDGDGDDDDDRRGRRARNRRSRGRDGADLSDLEVREGVLDLLPEGYGFLRTSGFLAGRRDVYVSQSYVRRFSLRRGDVVEGPVRHNKGNDKFPALARLDRVEGREVEHERDPWLSERPWFAQLTAVNPDRRLALEHGPDTPEAVRVVDLLAPLGAGQRGLVVSASRPERTALLRALGEALRATTPAAHLLSVLVDERPEVVSELERTLGAEVAASTFDRPPEDHTQLTELAFERARRLVERGRDVIVLLDSLTRLTRAFDRVVQPAGRTLPGGAPDVAALLPSARLLAAARNVEEGGSLTVLAGVDVASPSDEAVLGELEHAANWRLRLDRRLERQRIAPPIDVAGSSTVREELLRAPEQLEAVERLRRELVPLEPEEAIAQLLGRVRAHDDNAALLKAVAAE